MRLFVLFNKVLRFVSAVLFGHPLHMPLAKALHVTLGWPAGEAEDEEDAADLGALTAASILSSTSPAHDD